jgi:hypothetical protein
VRPAGIAVGAVGLAGVGVGVVFGLRANGDRAKVLNASTNGSGVVTGLTQAEAARLDASARSNALLANVLMISGGALAATGLLMAVLAPSSPSAPVNAVQLSIGPASLVASGQF